ncbi:MAG: hypothetical protein OXN89_16875 [Bryobacterales bacterium]|nr:hypothetical protein [Bryobacterales bacterium]
MGVDRETSGRDAVTPTAEPSPPKRLTRDTQFIVTSVLVVGGLVLGQGYLLSARFEDYNRRIDDINRRIDDINRRIDDLHDDVREIRSMVLRYLAQRNPEDLGSPEPAKPEGGSAAGDGHPPSKQVR